MSGSKHGVYRMHIAANRINLVSPNILAMRKMSNTHTHTATAAPPPAMAQVNEQLAQSKLHMGEF